MKLKLSVVSVTLIILGLGAPPYHAVARAADDVIESFTVDVNGGLLIIPVTINGKEHPFAVDTGSTVAVFDSRLKPVLNATGDKVPVNGGEMVELYTCPTATVGRSKLKAGTWAISTDLADLRRQTGYNISGILGIGFLRGKLVQINFDAGKLTILKRGTHVVGQKIPLRVADDGLPLVDVDLPIVGTVPFLIDTGCCGFHNGFLSKPTFAALCRAKEIESYTGTTPTVSVLDGPVTTQMGLLTWQSVSGLKHCDQMYTLDNSYKSRNGLGLGYLSRYTMTIDFHNWELILEKGKWFDRAGPANQAGIDIVMNGGMPVVAWVDANGPGWMAGVRAGDRIVSIDGTDARDLKLDQIGDKLYWVRGGFSMTLLHAMEADSHEIRLLQKASARRATKLQ